MRGKRVPYSNHAGCKHCWTQEELAERDHLINMHIPLIESFLHSSGGRYYWWNLDSYCELRSAMYEPYIIAIESWCLGPRTWQLSTFIYRKLRWWLLCEYRGNHLVHVPRENGQKMRALRDHWRAVLSSGERDDTEHLPCVEQPVGYHLELSDLLRVLTRTLSKTERRILRLCTGWDGTRVISREECGRRLGIVANTVSCRLRRIMRKLRRALAERQLECADVLR